MPEDEKKQGLSKPLPAGFVAAQWKPGQSGNPKGRPPGRTPYGLLRESIETNETLRRELMMTFKDMLMSGDTGAWSLFMQRADPVKKDAGEGMPELLEGIQLVPRPAPELREAEVVEKKPDTAGEGDTELLGESEAGS